MINEIILSASGNVYRGALAERFASGELTIPKVFKLDASERFFVFEVTSRELILRAGQSTRESASRYCAPAETRVLVWRKDSV